MAGLQVLEEQFSSKKFHVLGFYSDDFGKQGGSDEQIAGVVEKYRVSYPQFAIAPVSGQSPRPVFQWLLGHDNPGPKKDPLAPTWNFHKWLISREGKLLAAFDMRSYPGEDATSSTWRDSEIVQAIEAALG